MSTGRKAVALLPMALLVCAVFAGRIICLVLDIVIDRLDQWAEGGTP